ncbi:hypothetical protein [Mesonia sp. K4-1]|nr:hypothetical protein [Mesonia sp. K4-1]
MRQTDKILETQIFEQQKRELLKTLNESFELMQHQPTKQVCNKTLRDL